MGRKTGQSQLVAVIELEHGCQQVYSNGRRVVSPIAADVVFAEISRICRRSDRGSDWAVLSSAGNIERAVYLRRSEFLYCQAMGDGSRGDGSRGDGSRGDGSRGDGSRTAVVLNSCYVEVWESPDDVLIEMETPSGCEKVAV